MVFSIFVFRSICPPPRAYLLYIYARGAANSLQGVYHTVILTSTPEGNSNFINESMVLGVVL